MSSSEPASKGSRLEEVITAATTQAVNAALAERGTDASAIVTIIAIAGTPLADGVGERFRVLYRV
jgi:hypothetical protein